MSQENKSSFAQHTVEFIHHLFAGDIIKIDQHITLIDGKPQVVKEIKISKTMQKNFYSETETNGIWDPSTQSIIILRKMLKSIEDYAGTLIHEAIHAKSGAGDINRQFEIELTTAIGQISEKACKIISV